jgi:hypothetical protein
MVQGLCVGKKATMTSILAGAIAPESPIEYRLWPERVLR